MKWKDVFDPDLLWFVRWAPIIMPLMLSLSAICFAWAFMQWWLLILVPVAALYAFVQAHSLQANYRRAESKKRITEMDREWRRKYGDNTK